MGRRVPQTPTLSNDGYARGGQLPTTAEVFSCLPHLSWAKLPAAHRTRQPIGAGISKSRFAILPANHLSTLHGIETMTPCSYLDNN